MRRCSLHNTGPNGCLVPPSESLPASMVGSISLTSEVSLLLLVPASNHQFQIKCAKNSLRYPVRTALIVFVPPGMDDLLCFDQSLKPVCVQALCAEGPIERFHEGVVRRLGGPREPDVPSASIRTPLGSFLIS